MSGPDAGEARADDAQRLVLELVGDGGGSRVELPESGVLTLGCSRERAGLFVEGDDVAGVHCAIGRTKSGAFALKDLGSDAGTRLNGKHVQGALIKAGDEIALGSRVVRVHAAPAQAQAPASPIASAEPAVALPVLPGYRVRRRLGRGGMGEVWLAEQQSLAREVALKVLSAQAEADGEFVARFQAEARAAAALNHPNVVTVYDVGESRGLHYLSMEYMDGGNLEERVARAGPLPWREVVRALRDAAAGLVYAESKGIVHRDIKPANLMQNLAGTTKIADLGLAAHVDEAASRESGRKVLGTPHFMSPEQVRGERLDARSDLYSLGATAYRLLSGSTPFEGSSTREILRAQLFGEPKPLSERAPGVPEPLAALVERCMAKDPSERPPSAAALLRALQDLSTDAAGAEPARGGGARAALWIVPLLVVGVGAAWFALRRGGAQDVAANPSERPTVADAEPVADADGTSSGLAGSLASDADVPAAADPDDDVGLKLFEAEARVAYLELETRELAPAARADALRALAETYRGTTTAGEAAAQAERIAAELAQSAALRRDAAARVSSSIDAAIAAVDGLGTDATPAAKLAALAALATPPELALDATYSAARRALAEGVVEDALERAEARLALADTLAAQGDFAGARRELEALLARLADLSPPVPAPAATEVAAGGEGHDATDEGTAAAPSPDAAEGGAELDTAVADAPVPAPEDVVDTTPLLAIAERARQELAGLDGAARAFAEALERADRLATAHALARGDALAADLRRLDLARAEERLDALAGELGGERARGVAATLRDDVRRARAALETLAREHAGSGWRRTLVTDPRERRTTGHDAVGADASGILIEVDGVVEKLPWSVFGSDPREVHRLFYDRLTREWTAEERGSIAALLRLVSAARALAIVRPALVDGRLGERDRRTLAEVFQEAREWSAGTPEEARTAREARALDELVEALALAEDGRVARAAHRVEELLAGSGDTLIVTLASDGSWSGADPAPAYERLAPAASETAARGEPAPAADGEPEGDGDEP